MSNDDKVEEFRASLALVAQVLDRQRPDGWIRLQFDEHTHEGFSTVGPLVGWRADGKFRRIDGYRRDASVRIPLLWNSAGGGVGLVISVESSGRYQALVSPALSIAPTVGQDRRRYVLALQDRVGQEGLGDDVPGPPNATQAGDPREAVRLLRRFIEKVSEIIGGEAPDENEDRDAPADYSDSFAQPLSGESRSRLADELGVPLPDDLSALYAVVDGMPEGDRDASPMDNMVWYDLNLLVRLYRNGGYIWPETNTPQWHQPGESPAADPMGVVRLSVYRPGWIPFARDTGGNYLAVDMDPAENGRPGQVIRIGKTYSDGPAYVTDSVTSLLRRSVEALERGDYEDEREEGGALVVNADLPDRSPAIRRHTSVEHAATELDDVQWVRLTGAADLSLLRGAPRLWRMEIAQAASADLEPLRDIPVEHLDLAVDTVDLAPLAGHPRLRSLCLTTGHRVSLVPLRACPRLYGLDLSGARNCDLDGLAELTGLRYLAMRPQQWSALRELGNPPPSLATAVFAGYATLADLLDWIRYCGISDDRLFFHEGELSTHTTTKQFATPRNDE